MKKIIAIHRPLGADLQPLIFRIPRVFLAFFLSSALPAAWRGERSGRLERPPLREVWLKTNV